MKVLIACEESQEVCKAFRARGHEAYSCDIQEPSGGHPEWHILGDALKALEGGQVMTMDGVTHDVGKWDLLIAHPPCTYLSNAATRSFSLRVTPAEKVVARWAERVKAAIFFMRFMLADVPKIASREPCRHHEHSVQESRPDHSSVLLCRKQGRHRKLSHKAHLSLVEKPAASAAEKQPSAARARVRLKWGKTQENQLVRRHTQHAQRPRGPGKSQKQNCTRNCKSNG